MLANALHPLWEDQSFSEKLSIYLGMLKEAWIRNIAMVGEKLKAIETEGQELAQIVLDSENVMLFLPEDQSSYKISNC